MSYQSDAILAMRFVYWVYKVSAMIVVIGIVVSSYKTSWSRLQYRLHFSYHETAETLPLLTAMPGLQRQPELSWKSGSVSPWYFLIAK